MGRPAGRKKWSVDPSLCGICKSSGFGAGRPDLPGRCSKHLNCGPCARECGSVMTRWTPGIGVIEGDERKIICYTCAVKEGLRRDLNKGAVR